MYCCPKDLSCRRAVEQSCWSGLAELVGVEAQGMSLVVLEQMFLPGKDNFPERMSNVSTL